MAHSREKTICEEAWTLLNRNLDGDLKKDEVRKLYHHLAKCDVCRDNVSKTADLESKLKDLNMAYESLSLDESFNEKVMQAISTIETEKSVQLEEEYSVVDKEARNKEGSIIIRNHVMVVMGGCLIPIPIVDFAVIVGLQLKMLNKLSKSYGIEFSENRGKSFIASLIGGFAPLMFAKMVFGSFIKTVPSMGYFIGTAAMSVAAGATTYAIGKVFLQHFESGGTFSDFNPEKAKKSYAEELKNGERIAAGMC